MINKQYLGLAAGALLLAAGPVWAERADRDKPINIEADNGMLDQANQLTVFTGNVLIVQGTLRITGAEVSVKQDTQGNQNMISKGSPTTMRQKLDDKNEYVTGQANQITYDSKTGIAVLTGNALVTREGDRVKGHVITYNTNTEIYTVKGATGGKQRGRVSVILQPSTTQKSN
ncbi:MAG: lipopolysaccharide transport periplasmic protein LptA [Neisseriaceae bacterium]|nr:lipopolysaccharide transport periplasmic protein LptA [Neisseriaceae bacterium]MBP6863202.1 lipopolysaccharide transport periplasmic protein LptA [Neisseriaceae bacterium]